MAEGGGLLNRYRTKSSIGGSNPPLSASLSTKAAESRLFHVCGPKMAHCSASIYANVSLRQWVKRTDFAGG